MRAVGVFPGTREVRIVDHPAPAIASDREVLLRMLEVGVCGTDRALCNFEFGEAPPGSDYYVLGHESFAEVVNAGDGVTALAPGDLVVGVVRKPCGLPGCTPCGVGRQDFCTTGRYRERGIQEMHGFMTEMVVEEEAFLYRLPRELRYSGVLVEPLTIAEKAFLEFEAIERRVPAPRDRRTAVVLGAGPVGLLGAMLFRRHGWETWVYSRARTPNPAAAIAQAIGARYVSSLETPARDFARATGNIDLVYEAMGAPQAALDVLPYLGANGVYVFTGVPSPGERLSLDLHRLLAHMIMRNQVIAGTVNAGPDAFEAAIRDLSGFHSLWPQALASVITARYPLESFRDAIEAPGIKKVIELG